jgi:nucleoside-diphosphate-sugar epimerase
VSTFTDRGVLVIGGLGFIGRRLVETLTERGARVTVLTPSRERHRDAAVAQESRGVRVVEGDVRDRSALEAVVVDQHVVFNLAGQSGAVRSMEEPWADLSVNVGGMLALVEVLRRRNRAARIVFASSRLEYGRVGPEPVAETHPVNPMCLHAIHKLVAEDYLRLYERLYDIPYAVARITNPYGPGQPRLRTDYGVVNRLIHLALEDATLPIYGDGQQRRDYIYIDDVVEALLAMASTAGDEGKRSGIYNVGTGVGTRIADMAAAIIRAAGGGRVTSVPWPALAEQIETGDFVADITRIRTELGWRPHVSLEEGLQRTVSFYRAHAVSS